MAYGAIIVEGQLGAVSPAAASLADVYIVPPENRARGRVIMANRGGAATVRVSHAKGGADDALYQYLVYDMALDANASWATDEIALGATDRIRVRSSTGNVTFNFNGVQERLPK